MTGVNGAELGGCRVSVGLAEPGGGGSSVGLEGRGRGGTSSPQGAQGKQLPTLFFEGPLFTGMGFDDHEWQTLWWGARSLLGHMGT